jgi:hypothetical protein
MAARARRSSARTAYDDPYDDQTYGFGEFLAGERIGPRPPRAGRKIVLRGIFLLAAAGGVWAFMSGQITWPAWLPTDVSAILSSLNRRPGPLAAPAPRAAEPLPRIEPEEKLAAAEAPTLPPRPVPSAKDAVAPSAEPKTATAPLTTGALPPARRSDEAPDGPLRPAIADPSDPYQVRAAAAGLHPELSRALLSRLSAADYRNAGIAIKNAFEAPETAVYVWPRQRKPEEALFKVRFVPGAAAGCRRYVVSVTKDGWLTTAPPMEKCGAQPRQARRS